MARALIDDITGQVIRDGEGGTVRLTLDGDTVEVDLSNDSRQQVRDLLQPYFDAGRVLPKPGTPKNAASTAGDGPSDSDVRAWCRENGVEVNAVGRVNGAAREAYYQAHAGADANRIRSAADTADATPSTASTSSSSSATPAVVPAGDGTRPRPEQTEIAEDLLARGVPTHTVVAQTGLTLEQVRQLRSEVGA